MFGPIARLGDIGVGYCSCDSKKINASILTSSIDSLANGLGKARINDLVLSNCGHIANVITSNPTVLVNSLNVATVGDVFLGMCSPTKIIVGTIISGSPNVIAL